MKHTSKYDKLRFLRNPAIAAKIARFQQKVLTEFTELTEKLDTKLDTKLFFICIVKLFQFVDSCIYIFFRNMRIDLSHRTIIGIAADAHSG